MLDTQSALHYFCQQNSLKNFVKKPTRIADCKRITGISHSETLIDVVLHNKNSVLDTLVLQFPFSEHRIVVMKCIFKAAKFQPIIKLSRKLNESTINKIATKINGTDFSIMNEIKNVDLRWQCFKKTILNFIDEDAPVKKVKERKMKSVEWYDEELLKKRDHSISLYVRYCNSKLHSDLEIFKECRRDYQKLFKKKRIEYFLKKSAGSFKSSKQFWEFYSSSIKLKKCQNNSNQIPSMLINNNTIYDDKEIAQEFNKFFTTLGVKNDVEYIESQ